MKLINLRAENIKRLVAIEISPTGAVVELTGKNKQGKSSTLDAIWWGIAGATHIQKSPIREGADEAIIVLDMGELKITRTFKRREKTEKDQKEYATKLTLTFADGREPKSPQTILDGLLDALCFDPLQFKRAEPKKQYQALRAMIPGVDFDALDDQNRADYNKRTEISGKADQKRSAADIIVVAKDTPAEPIDETAITDAMAAAGATNSDIEGRRLRRESAQESIGTGRHAAVLARTESEKVMDKARQDAAAIIAEGERARDQLVSQADEFETKANDLEKKLAEAPELPPLVNTDDLKTQLEAAKQTNTKVALRTNKVTLTAEADALDREIGQITGRIKARDQAKQDAIAAAKLPVEGLGFGDGEILLNGKPFDQASDAEQLRVSCAIAMAQNPKLRVMLIRDGSLLDTDSMKLLSDMMDANDFQCWIETVESGNASAVVIEDGRVKGADLHQEAAE